jgi:hypothetical protein
VGDDNVAYRHVAKRRLCKQQPLLGNARNIHVRNNRTVFSMWSVPSCYNREIWSLVESRKSEVSHRKVFFHH